MDFNAEKVLCDVTKWIKDFFEKNGKGCNAVIGISGGKDSSVAAALCVRALGKDRVIGVLMPNGVQSDIDVARELVDFLGIRSYEINIKDGYDALMGTIVSSVGEISDQTRINLAPRIRMSVLYAVSQSNNGRVVNTCNLSEDYVGYSTRYGDAAGDFSPLARLTVAEVVALGLEAGLPEHIVKKVPSDGLCGKTDEDNLGFTYDMLDRYIRTGVCEDSEKKARIDHLNKINKFKLELMPVFPYEG
ncbi:MAG: NAD(+) synthase [Clostridia bacterium]|nr:NAD(+) synthase [Clostridia bacterium]MBQ8743476.1 NAD(+) synthase [Clostridia bacterium]